MKLHRYENVDNKKLYQEISERKDSTQVTDYMAECFINIGIGLSHRKNFQGYTYRDEMILDGIEDCVRYCHNFNTEKSKNPFSYFTQIMRNAFLRRIEKEKKQSYIKNKLECIRNNIPYYSSIVEFERKIQERMEQNDARKRMGLERFCE